MLQPIFDLIYTFWDFIVFWYVCKQYNEAVVLRLGNYKKHWSSKNGLFGTGLHFYWPFGIDEVLDQCILPDTVDLDSQSLTTKDNAQITLETVIKFRVFDVKKFLLDITDQTAAFSDICAASIGTVVSNIEYDEIVNNNKAVLQHANALIHLHVEKYGIEILAVTFKTCQKCRTIRLINDSSPMISVAK